MYRILREMTLREMAAVFAGTRAEYAAYLDYLITKYRIRDTEKLMDYLTPEEKDYLNWLLQHKEQKPMKPCPA